MTEGLRKRRGSFFVQIPRDTMRDKDLSFRARGVLGFLLDMPNGWDVRSDQIAAMGKEGREAIRTSLRELAAAGYYRLERRRLRDGRVVMGTAVSESRVDSWARECAEYEGKAVLVIEQPDGSFMVQHKDGSLTDDGFVADEPPVVDEYTYAGHTGDGFSGPGFPGAGSPGPGIPASGQPDSGFSGPLRETEKGDRKGTSSFSSDQRPARDQLITPEEEAARDQPGRRLAVTKLTTRGPQPGHNVRVLDQVLPATLRHDPHLAVTKVAEAAQACVAAGWPPAVLRERLATATKTANRPAGLALTKLREWRHQRPPVPEPAKPEWCGECDERTRMVEHRDADRRDGVFLDRCPRCSPTARKEVTTR